MKGGDIMNKMTLSLICIAISNIAIAIGGCLSAIDSFKAHNELNYKLNKLEDNIAMKTTMLQLNDDGNPNSD